MKEAAYYRPKSDGTVSCLLCPRKCRIPAGSRGFCLARENHDGKLFAASYARVTSVAMDPIEKKPLYHFVPGKDILSLGSYGCNLACSFCQNYEISRHVAPTSALEPAEAAKLAQRKDSLGIAYTYNEPMIWIEYVIDCASIARDKGLANILVTNGYINPEPRSDLLPLIDALNIDIKSMENSFYKKLSSGTLPPVLETCVAARKAGCHVEVTNLIIPGENDSEELFVKLAKWIASELGRRTPLHLSAYFPRYKLQARPTSPDALITARTLCLEHLDFVYVGNIISSEGGATVCPKCGSQVVGRVGYSVDTSGMDSEGRCGKCGTDCGIVVRNIPRR